MIALLSEINEMSVEARNILSDLVAAQNRPMKYAAKDETEWKETKLPRLAYLLQYLSELSNLEYVAEIAYKEASEQFIAEMREAV